MRPDKGWPKAAGNDPRDGSCALNSLEVDLGSAYARWQFFETVRSQHVGAGNAVRFGDSGAAVTGYESPTPKIFGVESHPNGEGGRVGLPRNTSG
jgi:hypothetical protein